MIIYEAPDEKGGIGAASSPANANGDTGPSPTEAQNADGEQQDGSQADAGPVPYKRFQEVTRQRKDMEARMAQVEAVARDAMAKNQQWQQWAAQQQAAQQHNGQPSTGQTGTTDISEGGETADRYVRSFFPEGEQGDQAYKAMEEYFSHKIGKVGSNFATPSQVSQLVKQEVDGAMGQINSTFQVANRFQRWVNSGMITGEQAQDLQGQLNQVLQATPDLARNPNNVAYVAERLYTQALEQGQIRPNFASPETTNPLQPSGGGGPEASGPAEIKPENTHFSRLKGLDANRLRALTEHSLSVHDKATT